MKTTTAATITSATMSTRGQFRDLLGERLGLAMGRLRVHPFSPMFLRSDVSFEMPRIFNEYSGDISGRYIELLSIAGQAGEAVPELDAFVARVLTYQQPEGYFGAQGFDAAKLTDKETKIFWGNGRLLIGLMEHVRLRHDPVVLAAARRLGDFFITSEQRIGSPENQGVMADPGPAGFATTYCSCIEGLVRLFIETGERRYADVAKAIADRLPETLAEFHTHGRMSALRGMVDLAVATSDQAMMARVIRQWEAMATDHVTCLGGMREHFSARCLRDEGCAVADWQMLSQKLFAVTRDNRYLESAEHCMLNHLLGNQFCNGGFGHQPFLLEILRPRPSVIAGLGWQDYRAPGNEGTEAYWCCSFHGPRALVEGARNAATAPMPGLIDINLYLSADIEIAGLKLRIAADPTLQSSVITVTQAPSTPLALSLRVPAWSNAPTARLAATGEQERALAIGADGRWNTGTRVWRSGDVIRVALNPAFRIVPGVHSEQRGDVHDHDSLFYGPWLLGYDNRDALLGGQGMDGNNTITKVLFLEGRSDPVSFPYKTVVECRDQKKMIWVTRALVPVAMRLKDAPLRVIHTIERRPYASLSPQQREELAVSPVP